MRVATISVLIIVLSFGPAGSTPAERPEPPTELKLENLLQRPLAEEFTPGREVIVSYVEIPSNTTMDRHWHPGEEFHYYLEGEVEIVVEGEPPTVGRPGTVGHVPFKKMHTAITGEKGAKVLVFRVHTQGEPVRHLEGGGSAEQ